MIYVSSAFDKKYGYLSNDFYYPIKINDQVFPTVSHYIQSKKYDGTIYEHVLRQKQTPFLTRKYGQALERRQIDHTGRILFHKTAGHLSGNSDEFYPTDIPREQLEKILRIKFSVNNLGKRLKTITENVFVSDELTSEIINDIRQNIT